MLYNKDGAPLFKLAQKIKKDSKVLFTDLKKLRIRHDALDPLWSVSPTSVGREERSDAQQEGIETSESELSRNLQIGDLEPCLESLELFVSSDVIHQELNIELDHSMPIASLFKYEFAKMKPPPPEASEADRTHDKESIPGTSNLGKKGGRKAKPKRDRKAEAERARLNKLAREEAANVSISIENTAGQTRQERELQHMLDASAGFRAPGIPTTPMPSAVDDEWRRTAEYDPSITDANSKGKGRPSAVPVNQPTVPRVVSTVDNRDSFNFFNAGWILPADQKRGGRVPVSQQSQIPTLPPPRKKQKTGI